MNSLSDDMNQVATVWNYFTNNNIVDLLFEIFSLLIVLNTDKLLGVAFLEQYLQYVSLIAFEVLFEMNCLITVS